MRIVKAFLVGLFIVIGTVHADDREVVTSVKYVTDELAGRQDKIPAQTTGTHAVTYTNAAGGIAPREVKSSLGTSTSDPSLPTVGGVNTGLESKQNEIPAKNTNTVLTYTGYEGTIGEKGIYQDTGTYAAQSENLIDAGTFNTALKNGLDNEFVCAGHVVDDDPTTPCWLWSIQNTTAENTLLPAGYTPLEFIESTGTQWIDTGFIPNSDFKHTIVFSSTDNTQTAYINGTSASGGTGRSGNTKIVNGYIQQILGGTTSAVNLIDPTKAGTISVFNNKTTLVMDLHNNATNSILLNGIEVANNATATITSIQQMTLFSLGGSNYPGKFRLYSDIIEQNGELVRNFIPAIRDNDNKAGLYDTVTGTFFTNAATGGDDFTAGPEISNNIYIPQNQ